MWTVIEGQVAITGVDDAKGKVGTFDADTQVLHRASQATQSNKTERGKGKSSCEQPSQTARSHNERERRHPNCYHNGECEKPLLKWTLMILAFWLFRFLAFSRNSIRTFFSYKFLYFCWLNAGNLQEIWLTNCCFTSSFYLFTVAPCYTVENVPQRRGLCCRC